MSSDTTANDDDRPREIDIFSVAVELEGDEYHRYLSDACRDDSAMRRRIESLIAVDRQAEQNDFLAPASQNLIDKLETDVGFSMVGRSFGPFTIIREIGRGGMGAVFLAERLEGYEQHVAIKVLHNGLGRDEMTRRFRDEVQFTAALGKHPGIASLIDAGTTDDGIVYLVMDYVDGVRIDQFCDQEEVDLRGRLELFLQVCDAVQFAHRNTVIHRDLKPSNILVTPEHQVVLIDFGIAKLTASQPGSDRDTTSTVFRVLTPAYASPEQARGEPPTTSTDVYSLGVVLYVLLTGRAPYEIDTSDPSRLADHLEHVKPLLPHIAVEKPIAAIGEPDAAEIARKRKVSPTRLRRLLASDLGTIVLMAIRKEPARRYGSVDQFADDIRRFLAGHTVRARKDTLRYRVETFVRRNRFAVATSVVTVLALVAAVVGTGTQWARAERERRNADLHARAASAEAERASRLAMRESAARRDAQQAEREARESARAARLQAATARQVSDFMVGLFQQSEPLGMMGYEFGSSGIESNEPSVRDLLERGTAMIRSRLSDKPAVRSALMTQIARVYMGLGSLEKAEGLLDSAIRLQRSSDPVLPGDLADTLSTMGMARYVQGRYEESKSLFREAIEITDRAFGPDSPQGANMKLAYALITVESPRAADEWLAAGEMISDVVRIRRRQEDASPYEMAIALTGQAIFKRTEGYNVEAIALLAEAGRYLAEAPNGGLYATTMMLTISATINWQIGNNDQAYREAEEALQMTKRIAGASHPIVNYIQVDQAKRMYKAGKYEQAESYLRDGIRSARQAYGRQPRTAIALSILGSQLLQRGVQLDEAVDLLDEAVEIMGETLGPENERTQNIVALRDEAVRRIQ